MMKHLRKNGGFTLIEMVVCIAIASLVTMAATTVLMLALRVNRQTSDTASKQYTVRSLLTAVENAARDGSIEGVNTDHLNYWELLNDEGEAMFSFSAFDRTISVHNTVVMENIYASNAVYKDNLLNIVLVTKDGTFDVSIYCRANVLAQGNSDEEEQPPEEELPVEKFIRILASQYGSRGEIVYASTPEGDYPRFYSEWYIGTDNFIGEWNESTPWCACFVSWALAETLGKTAPSFAKVNEFMAYFDELQKNASVGNLVFFNTDDDVDADHIGVVVNVHGGMIYTIEGNREGQVALASYPLTDPRILGYATVIS